MPISLANLSRKANDSNHRRYLDPSISFGMKLVQMMASKIGGKLHLESAPGARFALSVPYAAGA